MIGRILLVVFAMALPAQGGLSYHFTTKFRSNGYESKTSGRVLVSNDSYRLELEPDPKRESDYDVAISRDADRTATLINREKKIAWPRRRVEGRVVSSRLFLMPGGFDSKLEGEASIVESSTVGEVIAGFATTKRTIEMNYRLFASFDGTPFRGTVHAVVKVWSAPALPHLPLQRDVATGLPALDTELAAIGASIRGMTLRHELTVTRTIEGGPPVTESVLTAVDSVTTVATPDATFEIPADIRDATYEAQAQ